MSPPRICNLNARQLNDIDNLALACFHCNRNKSDKTRAIDAQSDVELPGSCE
ncbi:HNH endonuclease [Oscillatoria nigro-viridis]|uniref:HNH endonuclease n=1 Tax=Phormidium nigroviride TaxID=482564 RepID=UPI001237286A|nr:HNH endonuclease [Oscillatoria nigro-viridis]